MIRIARLFAGMVLLFPGLSRGSESATVTIFCYSLQCQRGLDPDGTYSLEVTSLPGVANGELALDFTTGYSHSTRLKLKDELSGNAFLGELALDVPDGKDLNKDGFQDFFQIKQGVTNLVSAGAYRLDSYGEGSATATWNRAAGSKDGLCALTMKLLPFQSLTFNVPFELQEYRGQLNYTSGRTNVIGTVDLFRTDKPQSRLNGPIELVKSSDNRFNDLTLQAGAWTNESQQRVSFVTHAVTRDERWPTNYYCFLEFDDDADPSTFFPYARWVLSIDDANDSNRNLIPDLSDDQGSGASPRQPQLALVQTRTNLSLRLSGEVGRLHELQGRPALVPGNWETSLSLTLTNDPQVIELPRQAEPVMFWRAIVK